MESDSSDSSEERLCYKLRGEKVIGSEVALLEWSPTMDVMAIAFTDNSIGLTRLSWQRVWNVEPAKSRIRCLAWRPDGRVLGAGYENGRVALYCVENGKCLHETTLVSPVCIVSMIWEEYGNDEDSPTLDNSERYPDQSSQFLPGLPSLDNLDDGDILDYANRPSFSPTDHKKIKTLSNLVNILVVGDEIGRLHFFTCGILYTAVLPLTERADSYHVMSMCLSHDFGCLGVLILIGDEKQTLKYCKVDASLFGKKRDQFQYVTLKYGQIVSTLQYIEETMQAMYNSWEDSLLTVDRQLAKYSQSLPNHLTVADEFIILLGCGKARAELQKFLVDELTAGGVKKLGLSLEMSYDSIRKLLVNHVSRALQNLDFYLYEVLGIAKWKDTFGELGLSQDAVERCIQSLGSFSLKVQELLFVIDRSLCSLRIFFMWLYSVILKLSGDTISPIGENFTVEDLGVITDLLKSRFKSNTSKHDQTFSLERVGQYFSNEDLKFVDDMSSTPSLLETLLTESGINQESVPWIFTPCPNNSLRQLFDSLNTSVTNMFTAIQDTVSNRIFSVYSLNHIDHSIVQTTSYYKCSKMFQADLNTTVYCYPTNDSQDMVIIVHTLDKVARVGRFFVSNTFQDISDETIFRVIELSYYNSESNSKALSILFKADIISEDINQSMSYGIAQLPINALLSLPLTQFNDRVLSEKALELTPRTDVGQYMKQYHILNRFTPSMAAFSGTRRLAAIINHTGKRIRLFDVDADVSDEEDTDDDASL